MDVKVNLVNGGVDFLVYCYLGIAPANPDCDEEEYKTYVAEKCANRAYRDFNRTLRFNKAVSNANKSKFSNEFCKLVADEAINLIGNATESTFDELHKEVCEKIIREAEGKTYENEKVLAQNGTKSFYYGQAQKWINMTLKYMWLLGIWSEDFARIASKLHIPVDSYIITAVCKAKQQWGKNDFFLPIKEGKKRERSFNLEKIEPWSKWDYETYIKFQTSLREHIINGGHPLEVENELWLNSVRND